MIKICPACETKNPEDAPVCSNCLDDLSVVSPVQEEEKKETLNLLINGKEITVKNGDVIGRQATGSAIFKDFPTVSRKHARITNENGDWFIEDLNSTNGTYINGERIKPFEQRKIKKGDKVNLSMSVKVQLV
ncbi:FHA domain-containing protein [Persephonella sp.]